MLDNRKKMYYFVFNEKKKKGGYMESNRSILSILIEHEELDNMILDHIRSRMIIYHNEQSSDNNSVLNGIDDKSISGIELGNL